MSMMLTRMFAYITLASYLMVGTVAVRIFAPEMSTVSFTTSYSKFFSKTEFKLQVSEAIAAPEIAFSDIVIPEIKKIAPVKKAAAPALAPVAVAVVVNKTPVFKYERVAKNELPFFEPVKLEAVRSNIQNLQNLVALYKELQFERVAASDLISDEVSTNMAASIDAEPEFFEYPTEPVAPSTKEENPSTVAEAVNNDVGPEAVEAVDNSSDEVVIDDLIAFDYSKAKQDVKAQTMPTVSKMTTQVAGVSVNGPAIAANNQVSAPKSANPSVTKSQKSDAPQAETDSKNPPKAVDKSGFLVERNDYPSAVSIQITGTDLKRTQEEVGFEARFLDDLTEVIQDNNTGYATIENVLTQPSMTRAVTVLKRGFAPTNTDLMITAGNTSVSLPVIEETKFNELLAPFEARGEIGAVLVELDEENKIEGATLDVPYSQVIHLNENMNETSGNDVNYLLFVGVKAGNALLSYKDVHGKLTSKVIHIHERELTFESYFAEEVSSERVALVEEDLLSKEITPLIISSEEVKEFATNKTTKKINDHTFVTDFGKTLLGGRKYIELSHLQEPVFMGYKQADTLVVPSEAFMRHIVSKFEGSNLGNRCVVQMNLSKPASKVEVAAESLDTSIMTYTEVLDTDRKFYDSVGPKSKKIIVVGENQGALVNGQDGKINVKIIYQDDTVEFLGSYCSPNTYLVEQL